MHDEAYVGPIDPHAERVRGHDDRARVCKEIGLHAAPLVRRQPGVIRLCSDSAAGESVANLVDAAARGGVDEASSSETSEEGPKRPVLVSPLPRRTHGPNQVRAVEATDDAHGIPHP